MILLKRILYILLVLIASCKSEEKKTTISAISTNEIAISYAKGFTIETSSSGITILSVNTPWPNAESTLKYALVPKEKLATITLNKEDYDAIVAVPVETLVVTSTTHIPALEALGVVDKLIGFPDAKYVSSKKTRKRIDSGAIKELGSNERLNTEMVIELNPELVVGFSISAQNKTYRSIQNANIAVVYNGDWTEETPLGKAEWIKFFAPFFNKEKLADQIFTNIKESYEEAKILATTAATTPTIISGAMYKDVWYLPGGKSWAAQFLTDANADYLWKHTPKTGSLSLSWEKVLETGQHADFWIGPSQFTSYQSMKDASPHYAQFDAVKTKNVFTFASTKGETGGLLYYELAPQRPDLVLKDLIHILHPELYTEHESFFFKPLE